MVPARELAALKRSHRNGYLADRYGLAVVGADRLPGYKFQQVVETLDGLPPELVRDGPIAELDLGADLGLETYGETVNASVAIGLITCRGVGNRPHPVGGLTLFQATIVHEVGHTVAFADRRRRQDDFERLFWPNGNRDHARGVPISAYALLHPAEDFAESFLYYRYGGARLASRGPERYAWMRDNVFGGREFPSRPGVQIPSA